MQIFKVHSNISEGTLKNIITNNNKKKQQEAESLCDIFR